LRVESWSSRIEIKYATSNNASSTTHVSTINNAEPRSVRGYLGRLIILVFEMTLAAGRFPKYGGSDAKRTRRAIVTITPARA